MIASAISLQNFMPDFMPHGFCFQWDPLVLWLHVISDGVIVLSYFCIPVALVYLAQRRRDLPFNWIFWMFGLFIVGCGTTHLLEIWTIWHANYLLSGFVKAITAVASAATAIMLVPLIPKAIALPSNESLRALNDELRLQVAEREHAEEELSSTQAESERVQAALAERQRAVEDLQLAQRALNQSQGQRRADEREIRKLNDELEARVIERTAALQAANHELEAFTYSVSHDLRAPLRHISGFSRILLEDFAPSLPADAQHHLQRIAQGAARMGKLVDELLNLARVGRQPLTLQPTELSSIVQDVITLLEPEIAARKVQWKIADLPFLECDPTLVRQVFQNLIHNALKYSRPRSPAVIEIGQTEQNGQPVIFVRDNGVGFSMKYADKLFGVFQRLHRAEEFEGTGVGLAIVQRIVHKHGGRVWAEAETDRGATFYFTLGSWQRSESKSIAAAANSEGRT